MVCTLSVLSSGGRIQFAAQQSAYTHLGREGKERGRGAGKTASCSLREQMEMQC